MLYVVRVRLMSWFPGGMGGIWESFLKKDLSPVRFIHLNPMDCLACLGYLLIVSLNHCRRNNSSNNTSQSKLNFKTPTVRWLREIYSCFENNSKAFVQNCKQSHRFHCTGTDEYWSQVETVKSKVFFYKEVKLLPTANNKRICVGKQFYFFLGKTRNSRRVLCKICESLLSKYGSKKTFNKKS